MWEACGGRGHLLSGRRLVLVSLVQRRGCKVRRNSPGLVPHYDVVCLTRFRRAPH